MFKFSLLVVFFEVLLVDLCWDLSLNHRLGYPPCSCLLLEGDKHLASLDTLCSLLLTFSHVDRKKVRDGGGMRLRSEKACWELLGHDQLGILFSHSLDSATGTKWVYSLFVTKNTKTKTKTKNQKQDRKCKFLEYTKWLIRVNYFLALLPLEVPALPWERSCLSEVGSGFLTATGSPFDFFLWK